MPVGSYFSGNFAPMTKQADGTYLGSAPNYKAKAGIQWDDGYLLKPNVEENAVRTFVVPQAGTVSIARLHRLPGRLERCLGRRGRGDL